MENRTKKFLIYFILPITLLLTAVWIADHQTRSDFLLHVDFLDVGQGDSIFIQTYQGNQIIIDGGPNDKVLSELSKVMPFWDRNLDLLILTHPDADHVTGLTEILKRYRVKEVLVTGVTAPTAAYEAFANLVKQKHISQLHAVAGERIWLDSATVFDIYYPNQQIENDKTISTNNTSIVGKLMFGKTQILFTGDADTIVEDTLRNEGFNLHADILKVPHHGSKYSNSLQFIQTVNPTYAIIEVGAKNNYGHPSPEALDNLSAVHAQVFRTDLDHTIKFVSNGSNLYKQ